MPSVQQKACTAPLLPGQKKSWPKLTIPLAAVAILQGGVRHGGWWCDASARSRMRAAAKSASLSSWERDRLPCFVLVISIDCGLHSSLLLGHGHGTCSVNQLPPFSPRCPVSVLPPIRPRSSPPFTGACLSSTNSNGRWPRFGRERGFFFFFSGSNSSGRNNRPMNQEGGGCRPSVRYW